MEALASCNYVHRSFGRPWRREQPPPTSPPPTRAVFFPFPAQGHVAAALHLAKLLHVHGGVRVTFVHSERNRRRLLRSRGSTALAGAPAFRFASDEDDDDDDHSPQLIAALLSSLDASVPHLNFKNLLDAAAAAASGAPATCVVSDIVPVLFAAGEVGLPAVAFWTTSAYGLMASLQCQQLIDKGSVVSSTQRCRSAEQWLVGYLDMRLRDFLSFIRTTDPDDAMLRAVLRHMQCLRTAACAVVLNTFDELEGEVVAAMSAALPPIYTVGPLPLLAGHVVAGSPVGALCGSLTREDDGCLAWLRSKRPRTVVYANLGSIAVLARQQLVEFAWGLANSGYEFLLVIRNDDESKGAGGGSTTVLPPEFVEETKERGYVTSWCPQDEVLRDEAVGVFLTHCGWNSMLESITSGMPMLCWPIATDQ
ncbi:hypothetical protein ACP70R_027071 [Stipagrostis hirtigluma subsp. patula]